MGQGRREKLRLSRFKKKLLKEQLWERSNLCGICGKQLPSFDRSTLDHIKPLGKGGKDVASNIQLAHLKCNNKKGSGL